MTGVGIFDSHQLAPVVIELPHQRRVGFEGFWRGELLSSIRAPQTSCASARAVTSIFCQLLIVVYLKVGTPLSALIPAPERTTIFFAIARASLNAFISLEGWAMEAIHTSVVSINSTVVLWAESCQ